MNRDEGSYPLSHSDMFEDKVNFEVKVIARIRSSSRLKSNSRSRPQSGCRVGVVTRSRIYLRVGSRHGLQTRSRIKTLPEVSLQFASIVRLQQPLLEGFDRSYVEGCEGSGNHPPTANS